MKKLINYICLVITLTFFFITNVYAYGCKSSPIDLETGASSGVSSRTFTLTDEQDRTCKVKLKVAKGGQRIKYYIEVDDIDQTNKKEYTCNDPNVKFNLDGDISKGFNLENIQCSYTGDKFNISGISVSLVSKKPLVVTKIWFPESFELKLKFLFCSTKN